MSEAKIAILLSTYNGEFFLGDLLQSILDQDYENWVLYVRDDGSCDKTRHILERYILLDSRIILLPNDALNLGAKMSFMRLLTIADAEYYMFCDQDDVWLANKITKTYDRMINIESENCEVPVIVHSDLCVVDKNLKVISSSFWKYSHIHPQQTSFDYFCAYNNLTGCAMMINNSAKLLCLDMPTFAPMHDSWIGLVVSFRHGIISYIDEPLILYRQHNNNVVGAQKHIFFKRFGQLMKLYYSNRNLYLTINYINEVSLLNFIFNKIHFYIKLSFCS